MHTTRTLILLLIVALAGCATEPLRYGDVVTLKSGQAPAGYPPPGTVWRLDANDLKTLSPAPLVPAPPPPLRPPPRPNESYAPAPYYGPWPYWGPGY